jgi:hypothetical protein
MPANLELTTSKNLPELTEFLLEVYGLGQDAPFVRPEMLSCPGGAFSGFVLQQAQQVRGHCILSHVAGQTRIGEVWVNSEHPEDWQAAIDLATLQAVSNPETCEIVAVTSIHLGREALRRNGYRYRRQDPIFILDPKSRLAGAPELNLNLFAGDESYLHVPGYPFET